jgi:hypothetical protein
MAICALSLLLGLLLAQRFRAVVLVPATGFVGIGALTFSIASSGPAWGAILIIVAAATSLQFGYLLGLGANMVVVGAFESRLRRSLSNSGRATQRPAH